MPKTHTTWQELLNRQSNEPYWGELGTFLTQERSLHTVFPPENETYTALSLTPLSDVRVVILGQDPYHGPGQAHGLAFSVRDSAAVPPSLRNVFAELADDIGCDRPASGDLTAWAKQGVLLLNTSLSVRSGEAASHQGHGWEVLTDAIIEAVAEQPRPIVFILWGAAARKKRTLVDTSRHTIIESPHPSPLSAHRGFFGSKPFSQANAALIAAGHQPISWCL